MRNKYIQQTAEILNASKDPPDIDALVSELSIIANQGAKEEIRSLICHPKEPECWRLESREECKKTVGCDYEVCTDGVGEEERAFNKKIQDIERDFRIEEVIRSSCQEWEDKWSLIEGGQFSQFCDEIGAWSLRFVRKSPQVNDRIVRSAHGEAFRDRK